MKQEEYPEKLHLQYLEFPTEFGKYPKWEGNNEGIGTEYIRKDIHDNILSHEYAIGFEEGQVFGNPWHKYPDEKPSAKTREMYLTTIKTEFEEYIAITCYCPITDIWEGYSDVVAWMELPESYKE